MLAFYNLGQPQFYDVGARQPTFAHYLDLRQYYTSAKYFRELGYEGTYEADLLAYTADTGQTLESLEKTPMRDLYFAPRQHRPGSNELASRRGESISPRSASSSTAPTRASSVR